MVIKNYLFVDIQFINNGNKNLENFNSHLLPES